MDEKLAAIVMDDDLGESPGIVSTEFTFSPLPGTRYLPIPARMQSLDTAYAHVTSTRTCTHCIVKWQHRGTGSVELLVTVDLQPHRPHTIYLTPESGWTVGQYVLSAYDVAGDVRLLGRNSIHIIDVRGEATVVEPEVEFIHSLLSGGRAESKLPPFLAFDPAAPANVPDEAYIQGLVDSGHAVSKRR